MKLRILKFTFCFLFFNLLWAQDTWIRTYNPFTIADYYKVEDVAICQDSGYAVNGYYDYDDLMGYEERWGFLIKTDNDSNLLWAKKDTVSFMSESESDAFIEIDDGGFISTVSNIWGGTALIKRDCNGNREWVIDGADLYVDSMEKTNDGYIILGGRYNTFPTLRKITQQGEIMWTQDYYLSGSGSGKVKSVVQTTDGGFAATGYTSGNGGDIFVLKTDSNGDSLWSETYDGIGDYDEGNCIVEDNNSNLMITGKLHIPNIVGFLWYIDSEGNTIWTQEVDGYNPFSVISLPDNSFVHYCYTGSNHTNIYKFDTEHNIEWESVFNSNVAIGDRCIILLDDGGFICGLRNVISSPNIGLAKLDSIGQVTSTDEFIIHNIDYRLSNYPNPFNPFTLIQFTLPDDVENPVVEIFNIKGQKIKTLANNELTKGKHSTIWNGDDEFGKPVSSGVYFYKLNVNGKTESVKKCLLLK
ncbi:MAG: T9SS type A sorting domain-containing protein [Candidatus Tenebribacter burtonii]|jgi:hypothetical protein|nr:T9SS type A sorting domain-containing protein [Candidatus Tenebribacter burtonii]